MTLLIRPSSQPGDNVDGLLRAFFQAEMPHPWPSLEAPAPQPGVLPARATSARSGLFRSRLALAASIAVLIGGSLLLGGKAPDAKSGRSPVVVPDNGEATKPRRNLVHDPKSGVTFVEDTLTLPAPGPGK